MRRFFFAYSPAAKALQAHPTEKLMKNNVLSVLFGNSDKAIKSEGPSTAAVSYSVADISRRNGGFDVAGFNLDGSYRILSRKTGRITDLGAKQLDEGNLFAALGVAYCREHFSVTDPKTKKRVFSADILADKIRHECDAFGMARPESVRGPGLYLEGARLVVNYGTAVYDQDDKPIDTTPTTSRTYVAGENIGFDLDTPCATVADVHLLESTFESFGFEQSWGPKASLGWCASTAMGAVLPNCPAVILSAELGSGKTTWAKLQKALLGTQAVLRDGVPTEPQVLHAIQDSAKALVCDEFEPLKVSKRSMDKLAEVFNSGFTKSAGQGKFTRVIGGRLRYFNPPAGVAMCGITLPELDYALESRSVRLSLIPKVRAGHPKSPLLDNLNSDLAEGVGARMRRLLVQRQQVLRDTRTTVHQMLQNIGHADRLADTYSPVLAGYLALKHATVPNHAVLTALIAEFGLHVVKTEDNESPSDACLNVLLDRKFVLHAEKDGAKVKSHVRIRDAVRLLVALKEDKGARRVVEQQLEMLGVRTLMDCDSGTWKLAVASSQHHVGVRQLFQGTAWARGGWKDSLLRLKGAAKGQTRVAGVSIKVVFVELPASAIQPVYDDEDEQTAVAAPVPREVGTVRGEWVR
jgi:hypothetical protein